MSYREGSRFALLMVPPTLEDCRPLVIAIVEEVVEAAIDRGWIVLGRDSEVLAEPLWPTFNPPRKGRL